MVNDDWRVWEGSVHEFYIIHTVHCHWSDTQYSTDKCTLIIIIIIIILDIMYYNLCKLVQHVSIPSWDHHQGHLWEYELHKQI
jgi:hypothetical protein